MDNGNNPVIKNPTDGSRTWTLSVSKNYDTFAVQVGGQMPNLDEGISMLEQAVKALQLEKRKEDALLMQKSLAEMAHTQGVLNRMRGGHA